jgi:ribosomal protein L1
MTVAEKPARRGAAAPRSVDSAVSRLTGGDAAATNDARSDDDQEVTFSVRLPKRLRRRVKVAALDLDRAVQNCTAEALEDWLEKYERKGRRGDADAD